MSATFIKRATAEQARLEVLKTRASHSIGEATGFFRVPRVLKLDESFGEMSFEEISGLKPLRQLIVERDPEVSSFLWRAGRALAVVHEQLTLPGDATIPLPKEWMAPKEDNVYVHGDFAGLNLCASSQPGEVVIIDWSLAPYFRSPGTFGSRWFDIIWFVLYLHQGVAREALGHWNPRALAAAWLAGYQQQHPLTAEDLAFADRLTRKYYWRMTGYYCRLRRHTSGPASAARQAMLQTLLWLKHGRGLLRNGFAPLLAGDESAPALAPCVHPVVAPIP
jgi:hypothetical protein